MGCSLPLRVVPASTWQAFSDTTREVTPDRRSRAEWHTAADEAAVPCDFRIGCRSRAMPRSAASWPILNVQEYAARSALGMA